jgi:hypothetical protein
MLNRHLIKAVIEKAVTPLTEKAVARKFYQGGICHCKKSMPVIEIYKSLWYYQNQKEDIEIINQLRHLTELHPTRAFDSYLGKIRNGRLKRNRKRVLRQGKRI